MAKIKICLDAGHFGKYNQSPVVKAYYESDMNWKLHNLLKKYLEEYGVEVIQTRSNQATDLGLITRGNKASGCTLFLSIHSNAANTESVDAPLAIVPLNGKGDALGQKLADCVASIMGTRQKGKIWTRKNDSGGEWYGVIRGAVAVGVPGIILEHSYHTNTKAAQWLLNDANLDKLAKAEAKVIAEHYGLSVNEPAKENANVIYRVQVGAFGKKENAEAMAQKLKAAGYDVIIKEEEKVSSENKETSETVAKKSNAEIAKEVYYGTCSDPRWTTWGNGATRTERLKLAGYDPVAVQNEVNKLF